MRVRELMTTKVISVRPETTVEEIARLLIKHRISSVPVVDGEARVVGFVGEDDLFLKEKGIPFSLVKLPALFSQWVSPDRLAEIYRRSRRHTAADVMTRFVVCAAADDKAGHVAELMLKGGLKKMPVVEGGRLVGIISRADMLKLLVEADRESDGEARPARVQSVFQPALAGAA